MIEELSRIRPRGRHDVEVRLQRGPKGSTIMLRSAKGKGMPLTAIGYFAFLQMDGETELSEIEERIGHRFEGAGVGVEHLCRLVEGLQNNALLFEDGRAVRARKALGDVGIGARRERGPVPDNGDHRRENDNVADLVHAGWAALVGSEFPRAVSKFRQASEALPDSLRLASLVEVLERVGAGDKDVGADPWVGIARVVRLAVEQRRCPACGDDLQGEGERAYRCVGCSGIFEH